MNPNFEQSVPTSVEKHQHNNAAHPGANFITSSDLNPHDVLFGRGSVSVRYEGNRLFRNLVEMRLDDYVRADRYGDRKTKIAREIVAVVHAQRGRFLRKYCLDEAATEPKPSEPGSDGSIVWLIVTDEAVLLDKVKQTFRDILNGPDRKPPKKASRTKTDHREPLPKSSATAELDRAGTSNPVAHSITESELQRAVAVSSAQHRDAMDAFGRANSLPSFSDSLMHPSSLQLPTIRFPSSMEFQSTIPSPFINPTPLELLAMIEEAERLRQVRQQQAQQDAMNAALLQHLHALANLSPPPPPPSLVRPPAITQRATSWPTQRFDTTHPTDASPWQGRSDSPFAASAANDNPIPAGTSRKKKRSNTSHDSRRAANTSPMNLNPIETLRRRTTKKRSAPTSQQQDSPSRDSSTEPPSQE